MSSWEKWAFPQETEALLCTETGLLNLRQAGEAHVEAAVTVPPVRAPPPSMQTIWF